MRNATLCATLGGGLILDQCRRGKPWKGSHAPRRSRGLKGDNGVAQSVRALFVVVFIGAVVGHFGDIGGVVINGHPGELA